MVNLMLTIALYRSALFLLHTLPPLTDQPQPVLAALVNLLGESRACRGLVAPLL